MRRSIIGLVVLAAVAAGAFFFLRVGDDGVQLASGDPLAVQVPDGQQGLVLEGRVLDAAGRPVADAEVSLISSALPLLRDARDAADGHLLIHGGSVAQAEALAGRLSKGEGTIDPTATVRTDATGQFRFAHLRNVALRVWATAPGHGGRELDRVTPGASLELSLPTGQATAVRVTDEEGKGLSKVRGWVLGLALPGAMEFESDGEGLVQLGSLGGGPQSLVLQADGFVPRVVSVETGADAGTIALTPLRALSVEVFASGAPVDATLYVEAFDGGVARKLSEVAVLGGRARLEGLSLPNVVLRAVAGGASSAAVRVTPTAREGHVSLHLTEGATLEVSPVDAAGESLGPARVTLLRALDAVRVISQASQAAGPVKVGPIAPGAYVVEVETDGRQPFSGSLRLGAGENALGVVLEPLHRISGTVSDGFGRPVSGARVVSAPLQAEARSDEAGRFELQVPAKGRYTLEAHHAAWGFARAELVAPSEGATLSLRPGAAVRVRVESGGQRIEGARVQVVGLTGPVREALTGPDGVALIRGLRAGEVRLGVSYGAARLLPSESPAVQLSDDVDGQVTLQLPIRAHAAATTPVTSPNAAPGSTGPAHTGTIKLAGGTSPSFYAVNGMEFTDPSGRFETPLRLTDGTTLSRFQIRVPGYVGVDGLRMAEKPDLGTIELVPTPVIGGTVLDATGAPVSGARVSCDGCGDETLSLHDGTFALEVRSSEAMVQLFAARGEAFARAPGQPSKPVTLTLAPAQTLLGVLRGADGAPQAGLPVHLRGPGHTDTVLTDADGAFRFATGTGSIWIDFPTAAPGPQRPSQQLHLTGDLALNIGPARGTGRLAVRAGTGACWRVGLVKGTVPPSSPLQQQLARVEWSRLATPQAGTVALFDGLEPGPYAVRFEPTGRGRASESAVVTIAADAESELSLPACPTP